MKRLSTSLVLVSMCLPLVLSGCFDHEGLRSSPLTFNPMPRMLEADVLSLGMTRKTIFDHLATWVTGQDCSTPRAERDGAYCQKWPDPPPPPPELYCYASLARPTCYSQAYNQANDHLIGFVPASIIVR